jgi:amino acid adenylation domain-containing protein
MTTDNTLPRHNDPDQESGGAKAYPLIKGGTARLMNDTWTEYLKESSIHQLFERQAARTPDAVAVQFGAEQMSYQELNMRSNQLAHHLRRLGVVEGMLVGVCMERSMEMVVGMLAALKTGAAYLPLDPNYPLERLQFMLEDAEAPVLLTQRRLLEKMPAPKAQSLCIDSDWEMIARESDQNPDGVGGGGSPAYVIYTSGSTGRPKGVCIPHRAVRRLALNTDYVRLEPSDRVAQVSNSSFDAATFEIWGALLNGAKLVIVAKEIVISLRDFAAQIELHSINTLFLTTALFNQMAREVPDGFRGLKHLLFGGEAVDPKWVREVIGRGKPQRLLHVYGPTESTTFASWHLVSQVEEWDRTVPIGIPIANTEIYLLDLDMRLTPVGVAGELYIGGEGLAYGYINHPGQTAEKFVPHPVGGEGGARLYKSGDMAKYLADGAIEYIGRIDQQVKLRGHRIELGEVEAALAQHESVSDSVVVVRESTPGEKRLVAYVVARPGATIPIDQLRSHLKEKLPEYMIPSAFAAVDELPLTVNGKVDRRALSELEPPVDRRLQESELPRTAVEEVIAILWADVLGVERVGVHDDFLELGGHSLLLTRLASRLREAFRIEIPIRALFESLTVAQQSVRLEDLGRAARQDVTRIAQLHITLNQMSDTEVRTLLATKGD